MRGHKEFHRLDRIGWLRAAVLGANDGVISVASLIVGVAAAGSEPRQVVLTGVAGLVAGAVSMAAGEYVSVRSQADTEHADLLKEKAELETEPERELAELTAIYVGRGLDEPLARKVAEKLTARDALAAHARDELGITETLRARPVQASLASALSFALGAAVPVVVAMLAPPARIEVLCSATAILALALLGGSAAYAGGAPVLRGSARVMFWGVLAMVLSAAVGRWLGPALSPGAI